MHSRLAKDSISLGPKSVPIAAARPALDLFELGTP
jgi:hypothetical protein